MSFRPCVIVPTFDNPDTIARVVESIRAHIQDVIVVDDGSGPRAQAVIAELRERGLVRVVRRDQNGGKGAAVKSGFAAAAKSGYTHALQLDADGQHDVSDIPKFLAAAATDPGCLVLGAPVFDAAAPRARTVGRRVSVGFAHLETRDRSIDDPLCGFRVYPLASALACAPRADHMDFDPEIAVRMVWRGVRVRNVPTRVRYERGGVSHFQLVRDNVRISLMHSRLMCIMIVRLVVGLVFGQRARSKLMP
jgi:glycosyltransferase involved in cell wall biosynthesis